MKILIVIIALGLLASSCKAPLKKETAPVTTPAIDSLPATPKFTLAMVVNQKDLSCYMPLSDGIGDTAHYRGKAYGFCSKACKNEFLRKPAYYVK